MSICVCLVAAIWAGDSAPASEHGVLSVSQAWADAQQFS